jgi:hypothetical protein
MSTAVPVATTARIPLRVRIGLVLAALFAIGEIATAIPQYADDPVVPTAYVVVNLLSLVVTPFAWRGATWARVVVIVGLVLSALGSTPAFFVPGVPTGWVVAAAAGIVLNLGVLALLLSWPRSAR